MPQDQNNSGRTYNILVYGIEKVGLTAPIEQLTDRNYKLVFQPFNTDQRFHDFDGVILFQGIFETHKFDVDWAGHQKHYHSYDRDELDKRLKEVSMLNGKEGFVCLILCEEFIDLSEHARIADTDLAKVLLNLPKLYRKSFGKRLTSVVSKRNEFSRFLDLYGASSSYFINYNDDIQWRTIAEIEREVVGMIIGDSLFFVPSLLPENNPENIAEYFKLLADVITSTVNKLIYEVPPWADNFQFPDEEALKDQIRRLLEQAREKKDLIDEYKRFKRILLADGDVLVDAVVETLAEGFEFSVDQIEEFREDIKILNDDGEPIIFGEIKGSNRSVKREHINQADSHRERAGLSSDFPTILIMNTHIKNARRLEEKDKELPLEQVRYATSSHVLLLRTLDLVRLLCLVKGEQISPQGVIDLLTGNVGWLKVTDDAWDVIEG